MKRFTFLLTALFAFVFGQTVYAQLGVMTSTDDVHYEYNIKRMYGDGHYAVATVGTETTMLYLAKEGSVATGDVKVNFIFKAGSSDGYYKLYATNVITTSTDGVTTYIEAPVIFESSHIQISADATATPMEVTLPVYPGGTGYPDKTMGGKYGLNMKFSYSGTSSNNWGEDGNTKNSSQQSSISSNTNTDRPYFLWAVETATPAPIVFSATSEGTLASYSTPVAAKIPSSVYAYYASEDPTSGTLTLTSIDDGIIPAGEGVIVKANKDLSSTVVETEAAASAGTATSYLKATSMATPSGNSTYTTSTSNITYNSSAHTATVTESATSYVSVTNSANIYGLGTVNGTQGFYHFTGYSDGGTLSMPAYKAYLTTSTINAGSIKLQFPDGSTTSINGVNVEQINKGAIYDLSGRRVATPVKGSLYIQNGKKYIAE